MLARRRRPAVLGGDALFPSPLYITHPRLPERAALNRYIDTIYDSGRLTNNGPLVRKLEDRLAQKLDAGFCAAFCNGTGVARGAAFGKAIADLASGRSSPVVDILKTRASPSKPYPRPVTAMGVRIVTAVRFRQAGAEV